jgi:tRNA(Arg) A34 adenosine deaminase TadA
LLSETLPFKGATPRVAGEQRRGHLQTSRRRILTAAAFLLGAGFVNALPALGQSEQEENHERWLRRALECGARNPRAPFGAVIVDRASNQELSWGVNHTIDGPIWHGEIDALQACPRRSQDFEWKGLALYTTAEPCPMCQSAILWAGISLVVFGTSSQRLAEIGWEGIDLSAQEVTSKASFAHCQVIGGVLAAECDETFRQAMLLRKGANRTSGGAPKAP